MDGASFSIFSFALSVLLNFLANYVAWRSTGIAALHIWAISNLITFAGFGALFFYKQSGWKWLILLQNAFYLISFILLPAGILQYRGLRFRLSGHLAILTVTLAAISWGLWVRESFVFRTFVGTLAFAGYCFYIVYLILRHTRGQSALVKFAIGTWGAYGVIHLIRLSMIAMGMGIDDGQPFQGIAYLLAFVFGPVCTTGGYIGLILLIVQRLVDEKNSSLAAAERLALQYRELSDHDPLTNALNSRSFMAELSRLLEKSRSAQTPLCVLMADLDHFKRINDTYGHAAGDITLKHAVQVWQGLLRPADCLGRVGGEEFAIILPNTDRSEAAHVAERLRQGIASTKMEAPEIITASFGAAQMVPGETAEDLLRRADNAMYEAKNTGRNRVVTAK